MNTRKTLVSLTALVTLMSAAACAAPEKKADTTTESGVDAATATSAEDFGGMDELVKAAQDEGELNVIALPPDWANYAEIISTFEDKYDIKVNTNPRPMHSRFAKIRQNQADENGKGIPYVNPIRKKLSKKANRELEAKERKAKNRADH